MTVRTGIGEMAVSMYGSMYRCWGNGCMYVTMTVFAGVGGTAVCMYDSMYRCRGKVVCMTVCTTVGVRYIYIQVCVRVLGGGFMFVCMNVCTGVCVCVCVCVCMLGVGRLYVCMTVCIGVVGTAVCM